MFGGPATGHQTRLEDTLRNRGSCLALIGSLMGYGTRIGASGSGGGSGGRSRTAVAEREAAKADSKMTNASTCARVMGFTGERVGRWH
jgi:hypothetical protein